MPPNLTGILYDWGFADKVQKTVIYQDGMQFWNYETDERVGFMRWAEEVLDAFGAEIPVVSHADVYDMVYEAALKSGVRVRFNSKVTEVDPEEPSVTLETGEVLRADYIIGADGHQSFLREVVTDGQSRQDLEGRMRGTLIHSGLIPAEAMEADPDLKEVWAYNGSIAWMGTNRHMCGYPVSSRREYAFHIFNDDEHYSESYWQKVGDPKTLSSLQRSVKGCSAICRKLVNLLPWVMRTKEIPRPLEEEWVHDSGKVFLTGEAAHPTVPCMTMGAALGFEDAVVLGNLFSRLTTPSQVPVFLNAYQELRQKRMEAVQFTERMTIATFWIPEGPDREERDAGWRATAALDNGGRVDEGMVLDQWESLKDMYAHNANDEADNWFVEWGVMYERSAAASHPGLRSDDGGHAMPMAFTMSVNETSDTTECHDRLQDIVRI